MVGVAAGGFAGGGAGGVGGGAGGGGGFAGIEAVNPAMSAAAAVLLPEITPRIMNPGGMVPGNAAGPMGGAMPQASRVLVRPVLTEEQRMARQAELDVRVLAFQQEQARKGSASAQLALGRRYRDGEGVERNFELAGVWLESALGNGASEAKKDLAQLRELAATDEAKGIETDQDESVRLVVLAPAVGE